MSLTVWIVIIIGLTAFYIGAARRMTNQIIMEIKASSELDHQRQVYELDSVGTLTVYPREAILELVDGSVVVIPKMDEATDPKEKP